MEEKLREREKPKKLRVSFPDGETFCYTSSKETYVKTLRKIGIELLNNIDLLANGEPLLTHRTAHKHKQNFVELEGGWYVYTGGNTHEKYIRLRIISDQLKLNLTIDKSDEFIGEKVQRGGKGMSFLQVHFPDGTCIGESNTTETFFESIIKIGIERVEKLNLKFNNKELISLTRKYNSQIQIDTDKWLVVPGATKDKVKMLKVINVMLHLGMNIEYT